jgi:hypothetical protein
MNRTFIDREEKCTKIGQFSRKSKAFHSKTNQLVICMATIPDTFFSIPATTEDEHGYIGLRDDGELEFRPHTDQGGITPDQYRKNYKKGCK